MWIFNVPTILLWYTAPPTLGLDPKDPATLWLEAVYTQEIPLTIHTEDK